MIQFRVEEFDLFSLFPSVSQKELGVGRGGEVSRWDSPERLKVHANLSEHIFRNLISLEIFSTRFSS
jgi:hypothetical protein